MDFIAGSMDLVAFTTLKKNIRKNKINFFHAILHTNLLYYTEYVSQKGMQTLTEIIDLHLPPTGKNDYWRFG